MAMNPSRRCFIDVEKREYLLRLVSDAIRVMTAGEQASSDTSAAQGKSVEFMEVERSGRLLKITRTVSDWCGLQLYDLDDGDKHISDITMLKKWYEVIATAESEDARLSASFALQAAAALAVLIYVEAGFDGVAVYACSSDAPEDEESGFPEGRFLVMHDTSGGLKKIPDVINAHLQNVAPPFNSIEENINYVMNPEFLAGGTSFLLLLDDLDPVNAMRAMNNIPAPKLDELIRAAKDHVK